MGESEYTVLSKGEAQAAGMMQSEGEFANVPPHWALYIAVEDAQNTVDSAAKLGAQVMVPPTPIPGIGTFAIIQDPQGAAFSILQSETPLGNPSQN
ncbi:MAG: VOC family protein, partial [bacterium]|nr:VOC family protein [Candidatus Kapabacteria bacterium]